MKFKGEIIMLNKNERMNKLNAMGIETGKYFNVNLPNGLKPGATITLAINENGLPVFVENIVANDPIAQEIIADGYVKNTKLHRRFVMAQMFQGLNYKSWNGEELGYNAWIKRHGLKYTFDMMLEEVRVLGKLEERDNDTFIERSHFFTKEVIMATMEDYVAELMKYVDKLPNKNCKGIPYKRIKGDNIFVVDLEKKVYAPFRSDIIRIKFAKHYNEFYRILKNFMNKMIGLPYGTPQSKAWFDAYKGEGAFYTLKNLVMFHGCGIIVDGKAVFGAAAVSVLKKRLKEYKGEGWRMFALMNKVIEDNNFDFKKRMEEIYKH
jgi:hypothetical protein